MQIFDENNQKELLQLLEKMQQAVAKTVPAKPEKPESKKEAMLRQIARFWYNKYPHG